MKRVLYLAILSLVASMMFAPAALSQSRGPSGADGTFNCADFDFQEDAQSFFNNDPGDTNGLDGPIGPGFTGQPGVACEELPSRGTATDGGMTQQPTTPTQYVQPTTPTTTQGDLDCADFATQEEAQQFLLADDPYGLDADNDGQACEDSLNTASGQFIGPCPPGQIAVGEGCTTDPEGDVPQVQQPAAPQQPAQTAAPQATAPMTTAPTTAPTMSELPTTGGPSLLIPAGVLLASGLIGLGAMRRK